MFHESFLYNPQGPDIALGSSPIGVVLGHLRPLQLVVPRHLCVYERLSCTGIPRLKLGAFAKLQMQTLSPFSSYSACAVRQGNTLHLWIWDAAIESDFARKHGGNTKFSVIAYSVFSNKSTNGVEWLNTSAHAGIEAQLWKDSELVDSIWFDKPPDQTDWLKHFAVNSSLVALGWPTTASVTLKVTAAAGATKPWGRNLIARSRPAISISWEKITPCVLSVATVILMGWGAWVLAQKLSHEDVISMDSASQDSRLAMLEPIQEARAAAQASTAWINGVANLRSQKRAADLLVELAVVFTRQGLVVRELDINEPTIQVTLVAPAGESPRLTAVLAAIENQPSFYDARFVDVSGGNGFKFSWRIRDGRKLPGQGEAR